MLKPVADSGSEQIKNGVLESNSLAEKNAAWCSIEYDGKLFQAIVVHVGRGKFRILKDNRNGEYAEMVVDASNILSCDASK